MDIVAGYADINAEFLFQEYPDLKQERDDPLGFVLTRTVCLRDVKVSEELQVAMKRLTQNLKQPRIYDFELISAAAAAAASPERSSLQKVGDSIKSFFTKKK